MRSQELQRAIDTVEARPCACVRCAECRGSGTVWFRFPGSPTGAYLGSSRSDDLDDMESCEACGGGGIVETCDRCGELDELYAMEEE